MKKFLLTLSVLALPILVNQAFGADNIISGDTPYTTPPRTLSVNASSSFSYSVLERDELEDNLIPNSKALSLNSLVPTVSMNNNNLSGSHSLTVSCLGSDESAHNITPKLTVISLNYFLPTVTKKQREAFEEAVLPGKLLPAAFLFGQNCYSSDDKIITFFVKAHTTDPSFSPEALLKNIVFKDISFKMNAYHSISRNSILDLALVEFKETQRKAFFNGYTDFGVTLESFSIESEKSNKMKIDFSFTPFQTGPFPSMFTLNKLNGNYKIEAARI